MFDEIIACLDGSPLAEKILPVARGMVAAMKARLAVLRVVRDTDELAAEENYMRERAHAYGAQMRLLVSNDPASAIIEEIERRPGAIPAMTTHGRTAWAEAILGSVALNVIRGAGRPVLLYRPRPEGLPTAAKISTLVVALDGGEFAEKMLPIAIEMSKSLNSKLMLVQALRIGSSEPATLTPLRGDILESSYLHKLAAEIEKAHGIEPDWDVLHGEPADAICRYVAGMRDSMLAMTSHARRGLKKAFFGSVAAQCIRTAGLPILIHWPKH
jgi:nucleotide-binding universal stress UspA family protein